MELVTPQPDVQAQAEQTDRQFNLSTALRMGEKARMLAGFAVCATLSVGAALATNDHTERLADTSRISPAAKLADPHYKPITEFDFQSNRQDAEKETSDVTGALGHAINVISPDRKSQHAYETYFNGIPESAPRPKLTEVINLLDPRHTFSGEYQTHPRKYPFSIYNATKTPIDVVYAEYASRAIRYWANEAEADKSGLIIGGHTLVRIKPRSVPHIMVMVGGDRAYRAVMGSDGIGATAYSPGHLTKSAIPRDGSPQDPFLYQTIGVEMCQSLINVYDEKTMPGGNEGEEHMRKFVYSFNDAAAPDNIRDLASQEAVCNMLGRVIAAVYRVGPDAIEQLTAHQSEKEALRPGPWLDYSLAAPEIPKFLWLARHVPREWNEIIAARHDDSPTIDYYRRHRHL